VEVYLGAQDLTADEPDRVGFTSSEFIIHPLYNPGTLANDIALIKLPVTMRYNGTIFIKVNYKNQKRFKSYIFI